MATPSGGFTLQSNIVFSVAAGATVPNPYTVPVQPAAHSTNWAAGTAANQIQKAASVNGTATAAPVTIDLSAVVCVDGSTGLTHLREWAIYNDHATAILLLDLTVANSFAFGVEGTLTTVKLEIQPGGVFYGCKPLGTNGFVVSTLKIITLDPASATIPYRSVFNGD